MIPEPSRTPPQPAARRIVIDRMFDPTASNRITNVRRLRGGRQADCGDDRQHKLDRDRPLHPVEQLHVVGQREYRRGLFGLIESFLKADKQPARGAISVVKGGKKIKGAAPNSA
jgi:hypothetical protein